MGRLTERNKDGDISLIGETEDITVIEAIDLVNNALEKLAHYEDLEEQGRLIEQKHGRWIHKDNFIGKYLMCSECSHVTSMKSNYCPHCGAKMDEVE